jgi:WhiB family redox-sensing transcriptional regulator
MTDTEIHYDWRHYAECLHHDPELFFPNGQAFNQQEEAKRICRDECTVAAACFDFSMRYRPAGIWAGLDEDDRDTILRAQSREKIKRRRRI